MTDSQRIKTLLDLYSANEIADEEVKELFGLINDPGNKKIFEAMLLQIAENTGESTSYDTERWNTVLQKILKPGAPVIKMHPAKTFVVSRIAAAAVVILLLSLGAFLYFNKSSEKQIAIADKQQIKNDVSPGGNKAVLTLADGTQIILDSAVNGTLTQQGKTKIIKLDEGVLSYSPSADGGEMQYNTISTPKGGQYQIVLSDGSKVWLNAASSLRFPASFTGKERNVELTGEGYFEITKNAQKPFHVKVNDMQVEVLGTHFNVNAYEDEAAIKTTLLEGSVRVSIDNGQQSSVIKPGQQAQLQTTNHKLQTINNADVDQAVAWKNGLFDFSNSDLQTVLRQLARWYDVDVTYEGKIPKREFGGKMQKALNLSEVLNILEKYNVHFKIEGKKIVVTP